MDIVEFLSPELVFCDVEAGSKKRILEITADLIAQQVGDLQAEQIYDALIAREQLGSTGIGEGIAIPHCRVKTSSQTIGCLIKLKEGINFDAVDDTPVDLLFFLLVPEKTIHGHLEMLRTLAEHFNEPAFRQQLREANTNEALYQAATGSQA